MDSRGNFYMAGAYSLWKISASGDVSEFVDSGDGAGNSLDTGVDVAVDARGDAYISGRFSNNVFRVSTPDLIPALRSMGWLVIALAIAVTGAISLRRRQGKP